jgi:hypothetical protein
MLQTKDMLYPKVVHMLSTKELKTMNVLSSCPQTTNLPVHFSFVLAAFLLPGVGYHD